MKRFAMATVFAAMIAAAPALATAATTTTATSDAASQETALQVRAADQIAVQGQNALHDIQLARVALFQGHPDKAELLTNHAATLLADDSVDWSKYFRTDKKASLKDDNYVAIDAAMGISEDFVASPEKQDAIKRANKKLESGDKKGAVEELRLAGIGVMENVCLMPLKQTRNAVAQAQKLMSEHKYYEANLALKGAEDAVIIDSAALFAS
ncbi:hypothetical protein AC791_07800 [Klebsiella sp. RIT-PI-d]|uniref:YfdX family protein n=1 Tax=Klebsiella sp. RIT-PI-d TaxID=1681196 RepID=UPI000675FB49|nr:YfdX family protein [Klebsiella sp. RIT-PI-d]KNC08611.1 hypothetical protein AC791_07800 [Klebsiella sp. RIT-PI-d]